ncbi:MAG: DUF2298 domain-containing protein, partial [Acidobacteria bacterium]|nr:DUF2298 domain-containing protein [Acidobacteriota bacterium]
MTKSSAALLGILLVAAVLRFTGLDWDQGQHLNPDERFLTMVTTALRWPAGVAEYFDEAASPLNPRNAGYRFYAYGTLPLTLVKAVADSTGQTGYQRIVYAGRFLSALFDLAAVLLVFLLALELRAGRRGALLAAALYALSVCAIQYAHFFVVDSFANGFLMASLLFTARYQARGNVVSLAAAGAWLGLAMGAKISALAVAPVVLLVIVERGRTAAAPLRFGLYCLCAFAVFRVAEPAAFQGLKPSVRWLADMRLVMQGASGDIDMPPGHQWAGRVKLLFPWLNLVVFGMGVPAGLAAWAGWLLAARRVARRRGGPLLIPVAWAGLLFFYHGTSYVMSMRYFLPIYGVLCILGAWLLSRYAPRLTPVVLGLTAMWAVWFAAAVYLHPHTRVEASAWIYRHVPPGSALSCEYWDDCLPLRLPGHARGVYPSVEMRWYDEDTPEKLARAREWLDRSDYIVLSSNRLSDSIPRLPARYPMTVRYYRALFDGSLGFAPAARFSAFPSTYAEEAFSVYDHPVVRIYRKTPRYDAARVQALLGAVRWQDVAAVRARDAARAPTGLLLPGGALAQADPAPWDRLFPARRFPAALWVGAMFLLGWAAMPLLFAACPALPDRGYGFAKTLGLLLPAWVAWWLGHTGAGFRQPSIWAAAALLGAAGVVTAALHRRELQQFVARHWRLLLAVDAVFVVAFLLMAAIRSVHTDLWHPHFGGEKPMDLAYLTATARSADFPPFNPWFAGGFINYYYFGFVLVAFLLKGCGIAPEVGFNIALPALYAMAASGLYSLALSLWPGRRRAWSA